MRIIITFSVIFAYNKQKYKKSYKCIFFAYFCNSYPCEWGGVVSGKPYLKNLDQFGKTVLEDLWKAVEEQFVEVSLFVHPVNVKMLKSKVLV